MRIDSILQTIKSLIKEDANKSICLIEVNDCLFDSEAEYRTFT